MFAPRFLYEGAAAAFAPSAAAAPTRPASSFTAASVSEKTALAFPLAAAAAMTAAAPAEKVELYSPKFYQICAVGGALCCGGTHTAVTPLDVVKCNMQVRVLCFRVLKGFLGGGLACVWCGGGVWWVGGAGARGGEGSASAPFPQARARAPRRPALPQPPLFTPPPPPCPLSLSPSPRPTPPSTPPSARASPSPPPRAACGAWSVGGCPPCSGTPFRGRPSLACTVRVCVF